MAWTERDERDHLADSARCGVCGRPDGHDCDHPERSLSPCCEASMTEWSDDSLTCDDCGEICTWDEDGEEDDQ